MRPSRAGRLLRGALVSLLAGGLLSSFALPFAAPAAAAGPTVQQLCGTPGPGQAGCLAERLAPGTAAPLASTASPAMPAGLGPADLADAYQLDTSKGYGQTVAVVDAYDDPTAAADLAAYRSQYGLPACAAGCFSKVTRPATAVRCRSRTPAGPVRSPSIWTWSRRSARSAASCWSRRTAPT